MKTKRKTEVLGSQHTTICTTILLPLLVPLLLTYAMLASFDFRDSLPRAYVSFSIPVARVVDLLMTSSPSLWG